jgi:CheY-like chemotaxis protein
MSKAQQSYRLTAAGRKLFWESQTKKAAIPADFRRVMGLVEFQGHVDVIRGYLRRYPDERVDEWLHELEDLGLVESGPASSAGDLLSASGGPKGPPLLEEDRARLDHDTKAAGTSLARSGVYIAADRVENRAASKKAARETVGLIVEDDPDQLALAELRVVMAGYVVRVANSAKALIETLRKDGAPDLLLLDVMLPDGDGFDILAELRQRPVFALLPTVMLTARDDPADIQKGLALGADGYITKPYSKKILADTISRVLKLDAPT